MNRMLKFVGTPAAMPDKQAVAKRIKNFQELYQPYPQAQAEEQSGRCSQCGVPFCQIGCPLQNNIPDWLKMLAEDRLEEAYALSSSTNNMPEICGRICPQDRLCEGSCVLEISDHEAVTIGAIEKHITEEAWQRGLITPIRPPEERPESVGIIGAGPAGMAAAEQLRRLGYQVTVYDRYDRVGGLLVYGIPNFKLEKEVVERRTTYLEQSNVSFTLNTDIGVDLSFEELRSRHNAVLIATGVYQPRSVQLPGIVLDGIEPALDFLTYHNRQCLGDTQHSTLAERFNVNGRRVVVIGGGDTAMDCVRTSVRQNARSVTCLYRRDRENMPGSQREVQHAEEEGVHFDWLKTPDSFLGKGHVQKVRVQQMTLGAASHDNRRAVIPVEGALEELNADLVILALGFEPENLPDIFRQNHLTLTRWGTLRASVDAGPTPIPGV